MLRDYIFERLEFIGVCFHKENMAKESQLAKEISIPCILTLIKETCTKSESAIIIGVLVILFSPSKPIMGFGFEKDGIRGELVIDRHGLQGEV